MGGNSTRIHSFTVQASIPPYSLMRPTRTSSVTGSSNVTMRPDPDPSIFALGVTGTLRLAAPRLPASQSHTPPGTESAAVWGLYLMTNG